MTLKGEFELLAFEISGPCQSLEDDYDKYIVTQNGTSIHKFNDRPQITILFVSGDIALVQSEDHKVQLLVGYDQELEDVSIRELVDMDVTTEGITEALHKIVQHVCNQSLMNFISTREIDYYERHRMRDKMGVKGDNCPCCGQNTIDNEGSFEICDVCGWEDDCHGRDNPDKKSGPNHISLNEARCNYLDHGSSKSRHDHDMEKLSGAVCDGDLDSVKLLIQHSNTYDDHEPLMVSSVINNFRDILEFLISAYSGENKDWLIDISLFYAMKYKNYEVAKHLVKNHGACFIGNGEFLGMEVLKSREEVIEALNIAIVNTE